MTVKLRINIAAWHKKRTIRHGTFHFNINTLEQENKGHRIKSRAI